MDGGLPQTRPVEVHHGVALASRLHDLGELLPGGQHETGVPEGQFQHQRPEGLLEAAYLVGRGLPWLARHMDRAQTGDLPEGVALVHLGMGQGVQGDGGVAGAARPAAQRHLLGHRAGREEGGGLLAEESCDLLLQGLDDAVPVEVGRLVQVVERVRPVEQRQALAERCEQPQARQRARRAPIRADAPCAAAQKPFRLRELLRSRFVRRLPRALLRCVTHARIISCAPGAGTRISALPGPQGNPQPVDNRTPLEPIALT